MPWILLALLVYTLLGAMLVSHFMRGMQVSASPREWVAFVLLWPLMRPLYLQLAVLQARIRQLEHWADTRARKR